MSTSCEPDHPDGSQMASRAMGHASGSASPVAQGPCRPQPSAATTTPPPSSPPAAAGTVGRADQRRRAQAHWVLAHWVLAHWVLAHWVLAHWVLAR
jgi:hypothetical protein